MSKAYQTIYYGAPGTGKSYKINKNFKSEGVTNDYIFRVTFHPEYTYSDFIGQLLPKVQDNNGSREISYDFGKGIFTQALEKAYEDTSKDVYLILEEMSRGDVAAIFGDVFQLLDRMPDGPKKGYSRYFINNDLISADIPAVPDGKIKLPPNLFIQGTVNTSDQNVFVMDTAFKRRFDWSYVSTKPLKDENGVYMNNPKIKIYVTGSEIEKDWVEFFMGLNRFISHKDYLELGEDKQLGQFFIEFAKNETTLQVKSQVLNKLLQYLWSDVQKASFKRNISLFSSDISSFSDLYDSYEMDKVVFSEEFLDCLNNIVLT